MDRKECIEIIEFERTDLNGFLIKLRARENLRNALHKI